MLSTVHYQQTLNLSRSSFDGTVFCNSNLQYFFFRSMNRQFSLLLEAFCERLKRIQCINKIETFDGMKRPKHMHLKIQVNICYLEIMYRVVEHLKMHILLSLILKIKIECPAYHSFEERDKFTRPSPLFIYEKWYSQSFIYDNHPNS